MRVSRFLMIVFLTTVGGDKRRWSWRENKTDSWRLIGRPIKETRRRSIDCLRHLSCLVLLIILVVFSSLAYAQSPPSKFEIERGRLMLADTKMDLKKNYYDADFHGMDI